MGTSSVEGDSDADQRRVLVKEVVKQDFRKSLPPKEQDTRKSLAPKLEVEAIDRRKTLVNNQEGGDDRRKTLANMRKSVARRPSLVTPGPSLSPRALAKNCHRRTMQKENITNLLSELNFNHAPFALHHVRNDPKDYKTRANAAQSTEIRRLCRSLKKGKKSIDIYTKNPTYNEIFKKPERSKSDEEQRFLLETTLSYSPVELVARNLIDRVANVDQRGRYGVWSQLGKPYSCLGNPAAAIPKANPSPEEIQRLDHEGMVSPFFWNPIRAAATRRKSYHEGPKTALVKKSEVLHDGCRTPMSLQCLLLKMGLSHLNDMKHSKFPRKQLVVTNNLRKAVMVKTPFSRSMSAQHSPFATSDSFIRPSLRLSDFRSSSDQIMASANSQGFPNNQGSPAPDMIPSKETTVLVQLPHLGREVYAWTSDFLFLRKELYKDLKKKLITRNIRRERCRSCPPLSQEVSSKLIARIDEGASISTPILNEQLWDEAEEHQELKKTPEPEPMPMVPELESITSFYDRVCFFVNNQRDDDPLMEVLVHRLKKLLEDGLKMHRDLLLSLCSYMSHLPENILNSGRISSVLPICLFICKELKISSSEYYTILKQTGLEGVLEAQRNVNN